MMNNLASAVLTSTIAFFAVATLFVVLRFVSQVVVVHQVALHDYLMLLAWVLALGVSVSICIATTHGLGLHSDQVPPEWRASLSRAIYAFAVLYVMNLLHTPFYHCLSFPFSLRSNLTG